MRDFRISSLVIWVAFLGATLLASCCKDNPPAEVPKTTHCSACDSLKAIFNKNSGMSQYLNQFDSVYYCDTLWGWKPVCESRLLNNEETFKSMANYYQSAADGVISSVSVLSADIPNYDYGKRYSYTYYSSDLTADTPYVFPHFLSFEFDESQVEDKIIPLNFGFKPCYWKESNNIVTNIGSINSISGIMQRRDTVFILPTFLTKVRLTVDGKLKEHKLHYQGVLSPDRETMTLTLTYYCSIPDMTAKKPCRVVSNYVMKRLK